MFRSTVTETAVKTLFPVGLLQQGLAKAVTAANRGDLSEKGHSTVHCVLWKCQASWGACCQLSPQKI